MHVDDWMIEMSEASQRKREREMVCPHNPLTSESVYTDTETGLRWRDPAPLKKKLNSCRFY